MHQEARKRSGRDLDFNRRSYRGPHFPSSNFSRQVATAVAVRSIRQGSSIPASSNAFIHPSIDKYRANLESI